MITEKSYGRIDLKFSLEVCLSPRKSWLDFGNDPLSLSALSPRHYERQTYYGKSPDRSSGLRLQLGYRREIFSGADHECQIQATLPDTKII